MSIDAVSVTSSNLVLTMRFYGLLGFVFEEFSPDQQHVEAKSENGLRFMIDSTDVIKNILQTDPIPSNHSVFAIKYKSVDEVDNVARKVGEAGFKVIKEPWDAFWGQRYCVVEDPDGYKVDLFCSL